MAKAAWANQSFKKSDRKKYADGGEAEKMDLSGSAYADNSGGTWGAMGARELTKQRDDTATRDINRATSDSGTSYEDSSKGAQSAWEGEAKADKDAKDARENAGFDYKPEPPKAPVKAAVVVAKPKPTNEGQADRTLKRVEAKAAKEAESNEDQNDRRIKRMNAAVSNAQSATRIGSTYKHKVAGPKKK